MAGCKHGKNDLDSPTVVTYVAIQMALAQPNVKGEDWNEAATPETQEEWRRAARVAIKAYLEVKEHPF